MPACGPGTSMLDRNRRQNSSCCTAWVAVGRNLYCNLVAHAEHFDTYGYDMIGHGFSGKPDRARSTVEYAEHLRSFMDAMSIEKASLLGLSLGSWVATKFAAMYPERVEKVTMVSAWGRPYTDETEV